MSKLIGLIITLVTFISLNQIFTSKTEAGSYDPKIASSLALAITDTPEPTIEIKLEPEKAKPRASTVVKKVYVRKEVIATEAPQRAVGYSNPATYCSCVLYVKAKSGINVGSVGYARNWPINSQTPKVGSIIVTSESRVGHVALVTSVGNNTVSITEANYKRCQEGTRTLPISSPVIRGYFSI
jgi:hypothetical protein